MTAMAIASSSNMGPIGNNRAYPVETHTHYMLGVHSNGRRRHTLDVVGVGDNRIGTETTSSPLTSSLIKSATILPRRKTTIRSTKSNTRSAGVWRNADQPCDG